MISIVTNIIKFITDPKNTRMLLFAGIMLFLLLFLHQCSATQKAKAEVESQKAETARVSNNWQASLDTLKQFKVGASTQRAQISGYELTLKELQSDYSDLLANFEIEKNKPPTVVIKTEYIIKEVIKEIPVYVSIDSTGNRSLLFSDSVSHNENNWRKLSGEIPFHIDTTESKTTIIPGKANVEMKFGMNLNLGLFQDKDTKKIMIKAESDYPGINFTSIQGASILDNDKNKKALRSLRKSFGIGLSVGYGISLNGNLISPAPYIGLGINYQPKFLQW